MASGEQIGGAEKSGSFYRNLSEVGSVALFGAGVVLKPIAPLMNAVAGLNLLRAGGGGLLRRHARKHHLGEQGS